MSKKIVTTALTGVAIAGLVPNAAIAAPKPPKPSQNLVELQVALPGYRADLPVPYQASSGWPLVFTARAATEIGTLRWGYMQDYPREGDRAYIVIADPDNCPELVYYPEFPESMQLPCLAGGPVPGPDWQDGYPVPDETYLEFTIDSDAPGVADSPFNGNPARRSALAAPAASGEPTVLAVPKPNIGDDWSDIPTDVAIGPPTGGSADDGYGYGADDDFPGLVVLAPHGVGRVYEDVDASPGGSSTLVPTAPRRQRNLAGFLNWVNYELASARGNSAVVAGMTVPEGLIAPLVGYDPNVADASSSSYSIEGGAVVANAGAPTDAYNAAYAATTFQIRAFVVNGVAPSVLADQNGDGIVSAADAKLAGYQVLSNEAIVYVKQVPAFRCGNQGPNQSWTTLVGVDLDGNNLLSGGVTEQCPAGAGSIKIVPQ